MNIFEDRFRPRLDRRWSVIQTGGGGVVTQESGLRLAIGRADRRRYADAQIDDYASLPRRGFPWRPPLRLTVRARASGPLLGTAGFGFWNNPFSPLGGWPALPTAIWFFFGSPPTDLPLALGVPGSGWKCACIDATTARALAWAPLAPTVVALNRAASVRRRLWPLVQRALGIAEAPLPDAGPAWREYALDWGCGQATFAVDGQTVLRADTAPRGPLGFVAWVDNQWAVATPDGRFGWGLLDIVQPQWLDLALVRIEPLGQPS